MYRVIKKVSESIHFRGKMTRIKVTRVMVVMSYGDLVIFNVIWRSTCVLQIETTSIDPWFRKSGNFYVGILLDPWIMFILFYWIILLFIYICLFANFHKLSCVLVCNSRRRGKINILWFHAAVLKIFKYNILNIRTEWINDISAAYLLCC